MFKNNNYNKIIIFLFSQNLPTRGYMPVNQGPLFDDDPGIMSEVETASTGFRRGGKQRSSLPVVRTPSKTLERPLGKKKLTLKLQFRFAQHISLLDEDKVGVYLLDQHVYYFIKLKKNSSIVLLNIFSYKINIMLEIIYQIATFIIL